MVWLWGGFGVPIGWLSTGFGVAFRWLCTPESMPRIWLWYGFGVALGWLCPASPPTSASATLCPRRRCLAGGTPVQPRCVLEVDRATCCGCGTCGSDLRIYGLTMKICGSGSSMPLTELEASYGLVSRVNRHAQRLECNQLAGALKRCRAPESGSKLHALQTLRAVWLRLCLRVYRVSAVQRGVLQLHGCGQAGPPLTHSTNGLVPVETGPHGFGHRVARGRLRGNQDVGRGLLPL